MGLRVFSGKKKIQGWLSSTRAAFQGEPTLLRASAGSGV